MAVENIIKFLPRDAVAFLRLADNDARFPIRPISEGTFLIGHGSACDLRLGDHEVPALHSILRVTRQSASITLMAELPELFVNGESVQRAGLLDGDIVEIGDVRLVFRFVSENALPEPESAATLDSGLNEENAEHDSDLIQELSAPELVTGLEHEFQLLNELQASNADSMDRLLNAARKSIEGASIKLAALPLRVIGVEERFVAADREQLQEIAAKVKQQESRLGDVCHVLEQIVSQQQIMTTALQSVADRLTELRSALPGESPTTRRASA
ncbi:MAG: hypothetical protein DWI29_00375 [Planctomycetota bacterium]|nr:MAG: hypothetical protein DWI29_00375 [Planctomycetota bacterium]